MSSHEDLVAEAEKTIDKVFGDTTVDPTTTRDSLHSLVEYIQTCMDTIDVPDSVDVDDESDHDIKDLLDDL